MVVSVRLIMGGHAVAFRIRSATCIALVSRFALDAALSQWHRERFCLILSSAKSSNAPVR